MFTSLIDVARNSPFKTPAMSHVECQEAGSDKALVPSRNIKAASTGDSPVEFGSTKYFVLCGLGGILSCGM